MNKTSPKARCRHHSAAEKWEKTRSAFFELQGLLDQARQCRSLASKHRQKYLKASREKRKQKEAADQ
jgi:hypothetical protein